MADFVEDFLNQTEDLLKAIAITSPALADAAMQVVVSCAQIEAEQKQVITRRQKKDILEKVAILQGSAVAPKMAAKVQEVVETSTDKALYQAEEIARQKREQEQSNKQVSEEFEEILEQLDELEQLEGVDTGEMQVDYAEGLDLDFLEDEDSIEDETKKSGKDDLSFLDDIDI